MPITTVNVTVGTTPTLIATLTTRANTDLLPITVRNQSGANIYLGGPDVTADDAATTGGLLIENGELIPFELGQSDVLYGITASGTAKLSVFKQRT